MSRVTRRSYSEHPATAGKEAVVHDDLTVICPTPYAGRLEAINFDNEGHVMEYSVDVSKDGNTVVFLREAEPSVPRSRLTYSRIAEDVVDVAFEIAPPGTPAAFKPYVSGRTLCLSHD